MTANAGKHKHDYKGKAIYCNADGPSDASAAAQERAIRKVVRVIIKANGGNGATTGYGGSGGVIIIDGELNLLQSDFTLAQAFGGLPGAQVPEADKECATGGAGTVWLKKTDTLIVSNGGRKTTSYTNINA